MTRKRRQPTPRERTPRRRRVEIDGTVRLECSAIVAIHQPDQILARLQTLHPKIIDLSLGRMERLLGTLGHPEQALPPIIHVAGTNGKGSTIAFLRAVFEAAGHRVHAYTSPHLVRFNERIRLAGSLIEDAPFAAILEECEAANAGAPITLFEITTAAGLLAFARTPADVLLLEVGLGGRFDATNVTPPPLATVITPVSMDHLQYLGDTLAAIAFEKAGILKPSVPAIIGPQKPEALAVIEARAAEIGAPTLLWGRAFAARPDGDRLRFEMAGAVATLPCPALAGAHQYVNAAVALAVASTVAATLPANTKHYATGLEKVTWSARLQRLTRGPLVEQLPEGWTLWLDGGHNEDAGRVIAAQVDWWRRDDPTAPVHVVLGMLNTKNPADYLAHFKGRLTSLLAVTIPNETATLTAEETAAAARTAGLTVSTVDTVAEGVARATSGGAPRGRVLIAGSLYLAGAVLAENG